MSLADLFWQSGAHTDTRIVSFFSNVAFLGMSHMTYCSETRDTKTAVRERVKSGKLILPVLFNMENLTTHIVYYGELLFVIFAKTLQCHFLVQRVYTCLIRRITTFWIVYSGNHC
jgi:hypothetical protein